ncbi:MAG: hypothetical protein Q9202_005498 [Teloschistes flavicans]
MRISIGTSQESGDLIVLRGGGPSAFIPDEAAQTFHAQPVDFRGARGQFRWQAQVIRPRGARGGIIRVGRIIGTPLISPRGPADLAAERITGASVMRHDGERAGLREQAGFPQESDVEVLEAREDDEARVEQEARGFHAAFARLQVVAAGGPDVEIAGFVAEEPAFAADGDVDGPGRLDDEEP